MKSKEDWIKEYGEFLDSLNGPGIFKTLSIKVLEGINIENCSIVFDNNLKAIVIISNIPEYKKGIAIIDASIESIINTINTEILLKTKDQELPPDIYIGKLIDDIYVENETNVIISKYKIDENTLFSNKKEASIFSFKDTNILTNEHGNKKNVWLNIN